tara:strand:+ start:1618 stop:2349 length:732 start_codon:yes stop_codon:yes gene_type:complete
MNIRDAYLVFGIQLGILFLLLLYYKKNIILKVITFSLLLASGARGPLIFAILLSIVYLISQKNIQSISPKIILRTIFAMVGLFFIYYLNANKLGALLESTLRRFGSLVGGEDRSALERVYRLNYAFNQPFEKLSTFLFGNGNGSFGILYEKFDKRSYPHNILVECFFELGLVGLAIFLILFLSIFRKISFKENVFGLLFLFAFVNAMKSSGITDLWILFSFMGVIISLKAKQGSLSSEKDLEG